MNREEFDKAVERLQLPFAVRDLDWVPNFTYPKADEKTYENTMIGVAPYVRREAVISRLNVVCGPGEWENIMEPLGKAGLYHGIAINLNGEWVRKFDGSQIYESDNDMDSIKSVVTQSMKRVGEVWGIGLYLKFVPKLFAVKRPNDEYDADETWSGKGSGGNYLRIRWDHPTLPKEFLPDFMTPEQYIRMKRIRRYFGDDKRKSIDEKLSEWEDDYTSITYEEAEEILDAVHRKLTARMNSINPKAVTSRPVKTDEKKDKPAQEQKSQAKPEEPTADKAETPQISPTQFSHLVEKVKELEGLDPTGINYKKDDLLEIKDNLNKHASRKHDFSIMSTDYQALVDKINVWIDLADDDLPF